jgi:hypothetical protein
MIGTSGLVLFSKHLARPARVAIAAGAVAALVVLAACTESQKTLTAPSAQSPRAATITAGGLGFPDVEVCVSSSSPAGTYKFVNRDFLSGFEDGGTGTTVENVPDGVSYIVPLGTPDGCLTVIERTVPDETFPDFADTWSSVTVMPFSFPDVVYDSTNCIESLGVKHTEPTPCGTNNFSTRAFANIEHGTRLVYFFSPAPPPSEVCDRMTFGGYVRLPGEISYGGNAGITSAGVAFGNVNVINHITGDHYEVKTPADYKRPTTGPLSTYPETREVTGPATVNGSTGHTLTVRFTDLGEPGTVDKIWMQLDGATVIPSRNVDGGNVQLHYQCKKK